MKYISIALIIFSGFYSVSQEMPNWAKMMYANEDPALIFKAYNDYFETHPFVKNRFTQDFKRWQRSFSRPEYSPADVRNASTYLTKSANQSKAFDSEWSCIGPYNFDKEAASRSYAPGAAHVYTIESCLATPSTMYAGTATAGLWKSINEGNTWALVTKDLYINQITAIEVHPSNPNIVYFGGAGQLYKSIDGGSSWNIIGDAGFMANDHDFREIVLDPSNSNTLFISTNFGWYKSIDAGASFTEIMTGEFQEIEFKPDNSQIIYTIKVVDFKTELYRSADGGNTFTLITTGWPNPTGPSDHQERVEIEVTPANPMLVYANATGSANGGSGTYGIYKSTDAGLTWTFQCCGSQPAGPPSLSNLNLMGWNKNGIDDGGQYYYDLAFEADPTDENKLHHGGVNHWMSEDGGANWTCPAQWSEPGLPGYVHADIHDIRFLNGILWIACDGGLFKSTDNGITFTPSMVGIEGSDFWGFGASPQSSVMLGGAYHNGTLLKDNDVYTDGWLCTGGGDGIRGFVNYGNDRKVIDDWGGRILSGDRTIANSTFSFDSLPNGSYIIGESSTIVWNPSNYNQFILGRYNQLISSNDNGLSYSTIHDFGERVTDIEQCQSDLNTIYVATYPDWWGVKKVWRTTDGGANWTNITPTSAILGGNNWVPYDIAVNHSNPQEIWLARTSQYSDYPNIDGKQLFHSIDGGNTWSAISTPTLNGEWPTNLVYQMGTDGGIYIGTRRAVYYKNNSLTDWQLFNSGLPVLTPSTKLVTDYKSNRLLNATNRSVYEVELYEPSQPIAQIAADRNKINCRQEQVQFVDHSVVDRSTATFEWTFPGGTPSSSNDENPIVTYSTPGTYDVSLTVTDANGTSSQSYTAFITYEENSALPTLSEGFETGLPPTWSVDELSGSFNWQPTTVSNGPDCTPSEVLFVNHYYIDATGDQAGIMTYDIDLSGVTTAALIYDYAYAQYGGTYNDGFRIDISSDCWNSYDTLFLAFGAELETVAPQGDVWEPADCSEWSTNNSIDLADYLGNSVSIRFVAINGYGNNFYLDNINLESNLGVTDLTSDEIIVFPNPSNGKLFVKHLLNDAQLKIYSTDGKIVHNQTANYGLTSVHLNLSNGTYILEVSNEEQLFQERLIIGSNH